MQFLADESCDALIVRTLREADHDVTYIAETTPGVDDETVLRQALTEERILLTEDRDFSALIFRDAQQTHGIVLIRIQPSERTQKKIRILALVNDHGKQLPGSITTLTISNIRIRKL
jgi:predicted nuclease of predicted toxin-antitoxin system